MSYVAPRLADMGVDGFFLDNLEVVEHSAGDTNGPCDAACSQGGLDLVYELRQAFPDKLIVMQNATSDVTRKGKTHGVSFPSLLDGVSHEEVYSDGGDSGSRSEMLAWKSLGLKVNGDAVYGTRPWRQFGEGPTQIQAGQFHDAETKPYTAEDYRFTTKGDALYAIELAWPKDGETVIHALAPTAGTREVATVELLGSTTPLTFQQKPDGLHIRVPAAPVGQYAYVYRITWR